MCVRSKAKVATCETRENHYGTATGGKTQNAAIFFKMMEF